MRTLLLLSSLLGIYACQSNNQKVESTPQDSVAVEQQVAVDTEATKTFFVLTSWATTDRNKAMAHIPNQQRQLMGLWNKRIVENIYYDQKGKFSNDQPLSLIAFFIKASTENNAHLALDTTDIVKNNLANYTLRPVGQLAFGRSENATKVGSEAGHVYAVIWAFLEKGNKIDTTVLKQQIKVDTKLQQDGIVENGYIDQNSLSAQSNGTQPGLYFINTKSEADARKVLDAMPLVKSKMATYGLRDVGQFFTGVKE